MAAAPYLKDYLHKDLRRTDRALDKRQLDMAAGVESVDLSAFGCE